MALSLNSGKGEAIAVIRSSNKRTNGLELFLDTQHLNVPVDAKAKLPIKNVLEYLGGVGFFKNGRRGRVVRQRDMQEMIHALENGDPEPPLFDRFEPARQSQLDELYRHARKMLQRMTVEGKEFKLNAQDGQLLPLPRQLPGKRERHEGTSSRSTYMICGPQNCGKSTLAGALTELYLEENPSSKVYLLSQCDKDPALDYLKPIRIKLDEQLIEKPVEPKELRNSLVIFDDIESIPQKALQTAVEAMRDNMLVTGRKENVSVINCSHLLCDWKKTRKSLNESEIIIFFPSSGARGQIRRFLDNVMGLPKDQIERIFKLPTRWVALCKTSPQYVLFQNGCFLVV